jgi:predicted ATPase
LYSICEGKDVGDSIFFIASQINHGREWILNDRDLSIAIAELNMNAGKKAIDGCDHKTAYSYLTAALSFLHEGHWESHYDLSLRLSFLMASAANSSCQYDETVLILRSIFEKARSLDEQLPSYLLLSQSKCPSMQVASLLISKFIFCSELSLSLSLPLFIQCSKHREK